MLGLRLVAGGFSRIVFFDIFGEAETTGEIAVQIYAGTVFLPFFSRSILADRNTVRIYHWKKNDADITPKIPVAGSVRQFAVVVTRQIIGEHIQKKCCVYVFASVDGSSEYELFWSIRRPQMTGVQMAFGGSAADGVQTKIVRRILNGPLLQLFFHRRVGVKVLFCHREPHRSFLTVYVGGKGKRPRLLNL